MTQPGPRADNVLTTRFAVEITGVTQAEFRECSGLQAQTEVFEYKEGGWNGYTHKLPGRTSFSNITLKWGSSPSMALWEWYTRVSTKRDKSGELKSVSIIQFDTEGVEKHRWNLSDAYPVKWTGPNFNAGEAAVGIETLELAFSELTAVKR